MAKRFDPLEIFVEHLCFSFADELDSNVQQYPFLQAPDRLELYNASSSTLALVHHALTIHLGVRQSLLSRISFSLRESRNFPPIQKGTYYIDVGYFLERRKTKVENVFFSRS